MNELKNKLNSVLKEINPDFPKLKNIKIYLNEEYEVPQTEIINNIFINNEKIQIYAYASFTQKRERYTQI